MLPEKEGKVIQKRKRACAIAYLESTVVIVIVIFYYLIPLLMPCIRGAPFKSTSKSVYTKKFKFENLVDCVIILDC